MEKELEQASAEEKRLFEQKIVFEFEDKEYEAEFDAYKKNRILLPDGRTLKSDVWLEVYPPHPIRLHVVEAVKNPAVAVFIKNVEI